MRTDGRTDRHEEAISPFSPFCHRPQNYWVIFKLPK